MNVILFTIGSHGDVHPFVGLGVALRRRGHDVTLITNEHFATLAQRAGLGFAQLGSEEHFQTLMHDPDLWHPTRGFDAVFLRGVLPSLQEAYDLIAARYVPGNTVLVASSLGLAARIASEKLGIPLATVHVQPAVIRTVYKSPKLPGLPMPNWFPRWFKGLIWKFGDNFIIDPKIAPAINEMRTKVGLTQPVKGILNEWWNSPQLILGMWPDWYAPVQPDWPPQLRLTGFPLYDEKDISELSENLRNWISAGDPPIAFTAGSAMVQGNDFFAESTRACVQLNKRGLLLARHGTQIPRDLPPSVRHVEYAPFGTLLPRCAAIVHHGGIGTTSQALAAGTPQIIMPMSHDQFDNAQRVRDLGCGDSIKQRHYRAAKITQKLDNLLSSPAVSEACRKTASRFRNIVPLEPACDLIEKML